MARVKKCFLQGLWHHPVNLYYSDTTEAPGSREMTSVSPEFILETKPKMLEEINMGSSLFTGNTVQLQMLEHLWDQRNLFEIQLVRAFEG